MKMKIESIPHDEQRYPTVGDYWVDEHGVEQVVLYKRGNTVSFP